MSALSSLCGLRRLSWLFLSPQKHFLFSCKQCYQHSAGQGHLLWKPLTPLRLATSDAEATSRPQRPCLLDARGIVVMTAPCLTPIGNHGHLLSCYTSNEDSDLSICARKSMDMHTSVISLQWLIRICKELLPERTIRCLKKLALQNPLMSR